MREVFLTFLRLGCTSFGGPVAHLGYFRDEVVTRKRWLDEDLFAQVVALCSVLPGPTSSQVGILIGLIRAGVGGACAAWLGFTLPSAIILACFAALLGASEHAAEPASRFAGALSGLALAAAAVVATAVFGLARTLCTDRRTRSISVVAAIVALFLGTTPQWGWTPIAFGAVAGLMFLGDTLAPVATALRLPFGRRTAVVALAFFALVIAAIAAFPSGDPRVVLIATCLRAGSLVFGGGHVVLPLLTSLVNNRLLNKRDFFAG